MKNNQYLEDKGHGKVYIEKTETFDPAEFEHQRKAMKKLDEVNKLDSFREIISIPTGGGKTFISAYWLLKNAVNERKKILWIAHRRILLDQALNTFVTHAIKKELTNRDDFSFCIVSGDAKNHSRLSDLKIDDDILIISKDSLGYGLEKNENFLNWISSTDPLYMVIDEAHHATARGYQSILKFITSKVNNLKLIGLSATPFRTNDNENCILRNTFNKKVLFKVDLTDLITKGFLAKPILKSIKSGFSWEEKISSSDIKRLMFNDNLPENIKNKMIENHSRNNRIVQTYIDDYQEYGQTIVFALNVDHAIQLSKNFNDAFEKNNLHLNADFVVTTADANFQSSSSSNEENARKIENFRNGKTQVLVNVQILTEGVDLPKTKTVFLTRPTVSKTLMTQMIGRALRGGKNGTDIAYIVSFLDEGYLSLINWQTPECIYDGDEKYAIEKGKKSATKKRDLNYISIEKIEEFAQLLNDSVDNSEFENLPFIDRIPVGKYVFSYLEPIVDLNGETTGEDNSVDWEIIVYNSTQSIFEDLIGNLHSIFENLHIEKGNYLNEKSLDIIEKKCREYFPIDIIPTYSEIDIIHLIKYFNYNDADLILFSFDQMTDIGDDVTALADKFKNNNTDNADSIIETYWRNPIEFSLSIRKKKIDINKKLYVHSFFGSVENLKKAVHKEVIRQIKSAQSKGVLQNKIVNEVLSFKDAPISKLNETEAGKVFWLNLQDLAYQDNFNKYGRYTCEECLKENGPFNVDHIRPVNFGGNINTIDNLQILCSSCNSRKSNKPLVLYNNFYIQPKDVAYFMKTKEMSEYGELVSYIYKNHAELLIKPYRKNQEQFLKDIKDCINLLQKEGCDKDIADLFGDSFSTYFIFKKAVLDLICDTSFEWSDILQSKLNEIFMNDMSKAHKYLNTSLKFYNLSCYCRPYKSAKMFTSFDKCDGDRVYVQFC